MSRLTVTSEIYAETDFKCCDLNDTSRYINFTMDFWFFKKIINLKWFTESVSTFTFHYPNENESNSCAADSDGDLVVQRRKKGEIKIGELMNVNTEVCWWKVILKTLEHHKATDLQLVGLQVWRGALLLADYIFHNRNEFKCKRVLELGSGVGLTGMHKMCLSIRKGSYKNHTKGTNYHMLVYQ